MHAVSPNSLNEPLVSVVMNCYNGEKYLREALLSVSSQTYSHYEIIFWDNASTDDSATVAKSFGAALRYFRSETTVPLGAARNLAIKQARGKYISFLDCDDELFPHALELQVKAMAATDAALVYGGVVTIDANGNERKRRTPKPRQGYLLGQQLRQYEISLPTVMLKADILNSDKLEFNTALHTAEDYCLFMHIAARHKITAVEHILAKYRVHPGALTQKTVDRWAQEVEYTLELIKARHPHALVQHDRSFKVAAGKVAYYRARGLVARRDRRGAMKALAPYVFVDPRYLALWLVLVLPLSCWDAIHQWYTGREMKG